MGPQSICDHIYMRSVTDDGLLPSVSTGFIPTENRGAFLFIEHLRGPSIYREPQEGPLYVKKMGVQNEGFSSIEDHMRVLYL